MLTSLKEQYLTYRLNTYKDPQAFGQLYDLYFKPIYQFIYFRIKGEEEAKDLTSQVFVQALQYIMEERGQGKIDNFRAFIYALARNTVIGMYRKQGRTPTLVSLDNTDEDWPPIQVPDQRQDPFAQQLKEEDIQILLQSLDKLKHEEYKEILLLRFIQGREIGEIAKILGKTPGNVRVLIHRALKALHTLVYEVRTSAPTTQK